MFNSQGFGADNDQQNTLQSAQQEQQALMANLRQQLNNNNNNATNNDPTSGSSNRNSFGAPGAGNMFQQQAGGGLVAGGGGSSAGIMGAGGAAGVSQANALLELQRAEQLLAAMQANTAGGGGGLNAPPTALGPGAGLMGGAAAAGPMNNNLGAGGMDGMGGMNSFGAGGPGAAMLANMNTSQMGIADLQRAIAMNSVMMNANAASMTSNPALSRFGTGGMIPDQGLGGSSNPTSTGAMPSLAGLSQDTLQFLAKNPAALAALGGGTGPMGAGGSFPGSATAPAAFGGGTGMLLNNLNQMPNPVEPFTDSTMAQERLKRRRSMSPDSRNEQHEHAQQNASMGAYSTEFLALEEAALAQRALKRSKNPSSSGKRKAKTFPIKLMTALMENPNEDAVAWLPDGKSFVIVNPDLFVSDVLVKVFKECKYASFVRKLHRWGFVRLTSGTGTDCFHHAQFQRGRMDMAARIVCTPRETQQEFQQEGGGNKSFDRESDKPPSLAGVEKFFRHKLNSAAVTQDDATSGGGGSSVTTNKDKSVSSSALSEAEDAKSTTTTNKEESTALPATAPV